MWNKMYRKRTLIFFLDNSISICLVIVSISVTMLRFHCTVYMYKSSKMLLNLPDTVKIPRINNTFIMFVVFFFWNKKWSFYKYAVTFFLKNPETTNLSLLNPYLACYHAFLVHICTSIDFFIWYSGSELIILIYSSYPNSKMYWF